MEDVEELEKIKMTEFDQVTFEADDHGREIQNQNCNEKQIIKSSSNSDMFLKKLYDRHKNRLCAALYFILFLIYMVYFVYCLYFRFGDEGSWRLTICTLFAVIMISWKLLKKTKIRRLKPKFPIRVGCVTKRKLHLIIRWLLYIAVAIFIIVFVAVDVAVQKPQNLVPISGIVIFTVAIYIFSKDRSRILWHTIFWGFALQFIFALIIMRTSWGANSVRWVGDRFTEFMSYSDDGARFVFGENFEEHRFIFKTMPSVIVFCAAIEFLSHIGVIHFIIRNIGGFLAFCLDTTPAESVNAAANIFIGSSGSAMVIKDYLETMEMSGLFVIMTSGMASIGGAAIITFIDFGIPADAILAASVMSAPAALAASKLYFPSAEEKNKKHIELTNTSKARNMLEAVTNGTMRGLKLVSMISAMIITFLAMMKFLNKTVEWFGDRAGVNNLTLEYLLSYIMYPIAYIMGTPAEDCFLVGNLLGVKSLSNSGVAYIYLSKVIDNSEQFTEYTAVPNNTWRHTAGGILLENINVTLKEGILSKRSEIITTYALCGFASMSMIGMTIGAVGALVPSRMPDIARYAVSSFVIGTIASYYTACVAGLLFIEDI